MERLVEPDAVRANDLISILRGVPEGRARWKKLANQTRRLEEALYSKLYEEVVADINSGKKTGCWMETVVERGPEMDLDGIQMA